jgi:hypothetical protein
VHVVDARAAATVEAVAAVAVAARADSAAAAPSRRAMAPDPRLPRLPLHLRARLRLLATLRHLRRPRPAARPRGATAIGRAGDIAHARHWTRCLSINEVTALWASGMDEYQLSASSFTAGTRYSGSTSRQAHNCLVDSLYT